MKTYTITSFQDLINYFDKFNEFNWYIFRGQSDAAWELLPKAGRKEYLNKDRLGLTDTKLFSSWKRYAINFIPQKPSNDWEWYSIAQHHGLATRLLDWTKNPLVAAFFAVNGNYEKDAAIYTFKIKGFVDNKDYETPFDVKEFAVYYPYGLSSRIILQRGLFSISDKPNFPVEKILKDKLHKIVIPKELKSEVKKQLDFYNINDFSIFQDLDSLSNYLNNYASDTINLLNISPPNG